MKKFLFILLVSFNLVYPQDSLNQSSGIDDSFINKKTVSFVTLSSVFAITLIDSYITWWKDNYEPFNFYKRGDGKYWFNEPFSLGIDKVGHFYTSYFFYHTQKNILLWGGHSKEFSTWFSAILTGGMAVLIEIGDGFSTFGFDEQDLIFNLGGLGYGILQDLNPFFRNFNFKWSFFPSEGYSFPPRFTEHYGAHIYWLTVDVHNLFSNSIGKVWPSFLQPAIGFSLSDNLNHREFVVGFDFNLNFLFDSNDVNWNLIGKTVDLLHLIPSPGVKYSPGVKPDYRLLLIN